MVKEKGDKGKKKDVDISKAKGESKKDESVKDKSKKYEKQTKVAVTIMVVLILSTMLFYLIFQEAKFFKFNGFKFYKEKEGRTMFYKTTLSYVGVSGKSIPFTLKLRNDPRDLDKIPVEGAVKLSRKEVVLSYSPEILECYETQRTVMDFAITLTAFGKDVGFATTDLLYSKEKDYSYATCKKAKGKTVIVMQNGEENKITKYSEPYESISIINGEEKRSIKYIDCYVIEVKGCEVQQGFERFTLKFIEDSKRDL